MVSTSLREATPPNSDKRYLRIEEIASYGSDQQRGNLIGIQPYMTPVDYASAAAFQAKMEGYLERVRELGWITDRTIVVLPEYIGTWLVAVDEKNRLYQAPDLERAMRALLFNRPFRFLRAWLAAQGTNRTIDGLFRMKATEMAQIYQAAFSHLAGDYGVTLVAGSIVLPSARIEEGRLVVGNGALYNTAAVYQPDGRAHPELVYKAHPISDELPFMARARPDQLPVFQTPAGRLGVLICADSWYEDVYRVLRTKDCELVAVPNNLLPGGVWTQPWAGYDPGPAPPDVDESDVGRLSEREAWLKYALAGRIRSAGATHGMGVFLHGRLWGMESDGHTILVEPAGAHQSRAADGAALINFWIN